MVLVKLTIVVTVLPFVIAFLIIAGIFMPGNATGHIIADLFSRIFDKLLWPPSHEVIISEKKRRR